MPSAEELAKYILTTGDENSVVELIEEMVDSQQVDDQIYKSNIRLKYIQFQIFCLNCIKLSN